MCVAVQTSEEMEIGQIPAVSIGMPVFNSQATVGKAIESILSQTYTDFELIISDNGSNDGTLSICLQYGSRDSRIRIIKQKTNIGAGNNFQFVLSQARGKFFMWAAADDVRTTNFIEQTVYVLDNYPNCVFSSTANCFEQEETIIASHKNFELKGNLYNRITSFFDICWDSHGCFYSLIRRSALNGIPYIEKSFLAADWAVVASLLTQGDFRRARSGLQILGDKGASKQPSYLRSTCKTPVEFIAPLYLFSVILVRLCLSTKKLTRTQLVNIISKLIILNIKVTYMLCREETSRFAKKFRQPNA